MADLDIDETDAATCEFLSLYEGIKGYIYDLENLNSAKAIKKQERLRKCPEQEAPKVTSIHWGIAAGAIASQIAFWRLVDAASKK